MVNEKIFNQNLPTYLVHFNSDSFCIVIDTLFAINSL